MDDIELRNQLENLNAISFGWALSCCSYDSSEAKDVLQTAYLKVLEGRARYNGRSSFKTWLFSVIRNTAAEERRRHWFRRLGLAKFANERAGESFFMEEYDSSKDNISEGFKKYIIRLPTRQREVLHLVFYQGMTIEEASKAMEVSVGSARTHYGRGKDTLRKILKEAEKENERK
jgi:RNA polymerase sigma factor (sigma-70 family)